MKAGPSTRLLLVDACVLIDFAKADVSVLRLPRAHFGEVHVTAPVFDEVRLLDASSVAALGLRVHEPSLEMAVEAAASRGPLSFQDELCLPPADAIALARMIAAENRRIGQAVVAAFIAKMSARE